MLRYAYVVKFFLTDNDTESGLFIWYIVDLVMGWFQLKVVTVKHLPH